MNVQRQMIRATAGRSAVVRRSAVTLLLVLTLVATTACGFGWFSDDEPDADVTTDTVSMAPTETAQEAAAAVEQARQVPPPSEEQFPSQQLLAALYDQILPSIVDIEVTASAAAGARALPFGQAPDAPVQGEGSGWIYDDQGHVVTNNHVVADAEEIIVKFSDGSWTRGEIVATDPQADLAVLQITAPPDIVLRPLPVAAPDTVDVGNWVLAFGTPFGLEGSMTLGIISATGRGFPVGSSGGPLYTLPDVIQTDTAINPGNSGGPLLNLAGEVVGVNFAINSPVRGSAGVGFAIPSNIVQRVVPALIQGEQYEYPYLGISGGSVTPQLIAQEDIPQDLFGVWVSGVPSGGPGAEAGLQEGDIITAIEGTAVRTFDELVSYLINDTEVGQEVTLTVWRNGDPREISVTLAGRPDANVMADTDEPDESGESAVPVSIEEAIQTARETITSAGLMDSIDSSSAELQRGLGQAVWIVTLTGENRTATVAVDAVTGEVLELNVS